VRGYLVYGKTLVQGDKIIKVVAGNQKSAIKKAETQLSQKYPDLHFYKFLIANDWRI
jgi:hypothetical protein